MVEVRAGKVRTEEQHDEGRLDHGKATLLHGRNRRKGHLSVNRWESPPIFFVGRLR